MASESIFFTGDTKGVFEIDKAICNFSFHWEISYDRCDRDQWWCNRAQLYADEQGCDTVTTNDTAVRMWILKEEES